MSLVLYLNAIAIFQHLLCSTALIYQSGFIGSSNNYYFLYFIGKFTQTFVPLFLKNVSISTFNRNWTPIIVLPPKNRLGQFFGYWTKTSTKAG